MSELNELTKFNCCWYIPGYHDVLDSTGPIVWYKEVFSVNIRTIQHLRDVYVDYGDQIICVAVTR